MVVTDMAEALSLDTMEKCKISDAPCHFFRLPAELRIAIYEYVLAECDGQEMWVGIFDPWKDFTRPWEVLKENDFQQKPTDIRRVCKKIYTETTDICFKNWKFTFAFENPELMQSFFASVGEVYKRGFRNIRLDYRTEIVIQDKLGDTDWGHWLRVVKNLKEIFGDDRQVMLESLELRTFFLWNEIGEDNGQTPPPVSPVESTVEVIKLMRIFPRLKRLVLDGVVLLQPEDSKVECAPEELPLVNFIRRS